MTSSTTKTSSLPAAPPSRRKLHLGHFAFMRALVQGVSTRESWDRYLCLEGEHRDARYVKRTIDWIRDEFAAAARRSHRYGIARLVLIDVSTLPDDSNALPSLEEFVTAQALDGFTEQEQIEAYQSAYGNASARQSRRVRLIGKQLEALAWLESQVAQPPMADDAIASWLHPDLASRLEAAGLFTLRNLVTHINGIGLRWWVPIKAIGAGKSARIVDWLRLHESSTALPIGAHVAIKHSRLPAHERQNIVAKATAIVPLDKFLVPAALDGSCGVYRAPHHLCLMGAKNDYEAILNWLRSKQRIRQAQRPTTKRQRVSDAASVEGPLDWLNALSHTQRAYLKEAERFLLWAVLERKKSLSSMTLEDCLAYRSFLNNPAPADLWCGPRGRDKWSPLWKPFEGPLSVSAQRHALTILKGLYKYLVDQCYLVGTPWNGVTLPRDAALRIEVGRSFTQDQWRFILQQAALLTDTSANARLRFALHLLYSTGLRLAEAVAANVDHLEWASYPMQAGDAERVEGCLLRVIGKGGKARTVPVSLETIGSLSRYLISRGLDPDPEAPDNRTAFLLGRAIDVASRVPWSIHAGKVIDAKVGITASTLYDQLKRFFTDCADVLAQTDPKGAGQLAQASTHWLRHTYSSHAVAAGMKLDVVQQNMGHAPRNTAAISTPSEDCRRMRAVQKAWEDKVD